VTAPEGQRSVSLVTRLAVPTPISRRGVVGGLYAVAPLALSINYPACRDDFDPGPDGVAIAPRSV
jgi:hypothetical protein